MMLRNRSMQWRYWLGGSALVFAVAGLSCFAHSGGVDFDDLNDAKSAFVAAGFSCVSDAENETFAKGYLISREPITWQEAGTLRKAGAMGPEWEGKVWITTSSPDWQLETTPDQAGVRIWGSVIAFGDEGLLNEIEDACRTSANVLN